MLAEHQDLLLHLLDRHQVLVVDCLLARLLALALVLDLDRKEVRRVKIVLLVVLAAGVAAAADAERVHILADLRREGGCKRR